MSFRPHPLDHVLELQVLERTLQVNGVCQALDGILRAVGIFSAELKQELFREKLIPTINGQANAFQLNAKVNSPTVREAAKQHFLCCFSLFSESQTH